MIRVRTKTKHEKSENGGEKFDDTRKGRTEIEDNGTGILTKSLH